MSDTVAHLDSVGHRYGDVTALEPTTLALPAGCMIGLIGPDGVGKSTLLSLLAGVRKIQTGSIRLFEGDLKRPSFRRGVPAYRLHAPRTGAQPVHDPDGGGEHRLFCPAV